MSLPFSQDAGAHVYTKEDFERHQRTEWSGTDEAQAKRLPGVMDSTMQWCRRAREDFKLGLAPDEQLAQRHFRTG